MTPAETVTIERLENALSGNPAVRRLDDRVFVVKQGSTFVMVNVCELEGDRAQVRLIAQLVKGVNMSPELAYELLHLNTRLKFGAFAFAPKASLLLITHSLLGGSTLDVEEIQASLQDIATLSDQYDDMFISKHGGQRMSDLLEASRIGQLFADPNANAF